jgi:hypothetical protein
LISLEVQALWGLDRVEKGFKRMLQGECSVHSHAVAAAMDKINDKYGEFVQYTCVDDGDG